MPRKAAAQTIQTAEGTEVVPLLVDGQALYCMEEGCTDVLVSIGEDGFAVCAAGHTGQPLPEGASDIATESEGGEAEVIDDDPRKHDFAGAEGSAACFVCGGVVEDHLTAEQREWMVEWEKKFCLCGHLGYTHVGKEPGGPECVFSMMVAGEAEFCRCPAFEWDPAHVEEPPKTEPLFVDLPPEMHEGKPITGWKLKFAGSSMLSRVRVPQREFWAGLRVGARGILRMGYEAGPDGYDEVKSGEHVVGLIATRKLSITGVEFEESADPTEGLPLWDSNRADKPEPVFRAPVLRFAELMENRLAKHDGERGTTGWREAADLGVIVEWFDGYYAEFRGALASGNDIPKRAADVANLAMMCADYVARYDVLTRICRNCGCTDARACDVGEDETCHWLPDDDLCSACSAPEASPAEAVAEEEGAPA